MRTLQHPDVASLPLSLILHALSDPVRLHIVRQLAEHGERCCGAVGLELPKPTQSHHFKVLREAGIVAVRFEGTQRCLSLRRAELEARCPGLLEVILKTAEPL